MRAEAYVIELPLRDPYTAAGHSLTSRRGVIVKVTDNDHAGWGEFVELPGYSRETVETALAALAGSPVTHSNPMAVAARRSAALDLEAKARGVPLTTILGGTPGAVPSGAVVARLGETAGTVREASHRIAEGYRKVKVKIGPGFDLEPLTELRRVHPAVVLAADANGSYRADEVPVDIDEFGLAYLEQPYAPEAGWAVNARLRARLATPLCLDESITGMPALRSAIAAGACDVVNLKPARLTGLAAAVELHDLAVDGGLELVVGGLLETGIGRAGVAALARLPGFAFPADLSASDRYWRRDLTIPPWELSDGCLTVGERPGIGVEVDTAFLDEVTISHHPLPAGRASF
jgi:O-succinylbenzoate synthase